MEAPVTPNRKAFIVFLISLIVDLLVWGLLLVDPDKSVTVPSRIALGVGATLLSAIAAALVLRVIEEIAQPAPCRKP